MADFLVKRGEAIQPVIEMAAAASGGRVVLENGDHETGTLYLRDNVELHLPAGTRLFGFGDPDRYDDIRDPMFEWAPENSRKVLIAALHVRNIAITGAGEINGRGPEFYNTDVPAGTFFAKPERPRPRMIQFGDCRNVRLEGCSFVDSPGWTMWLAGCEDVRVHGVRVTGCQQMINNDGIDIDDCRRVTVSDSFFRTGDDCLILRSIVKRPGERAECSGVTVTNCVLDSWCQAIRVGCPSDDVIRNCVFSNLVISGRGNGININNPRRYLQPGNTGRMSLSDVLFDNLVIESGHVPVWINVEDGVKLCRLGGLTFSNLRIRSPQPIRLEGSPETVIDDVRFCNVKAEISGEEAIVARRVKHLKISDMELV